MHCFSFHRILVLSALITCNYYTYAFQYSDLKDLSANCAPKDNCERDKGSRLSTSLNWKDRNCFCDNLCNDYGDCCLDAATYDRERQRRESRVQQCIVLRNYGGVYMRKTCPKTWSDDRVRELCAESSPQSDSTRPDPFLSMPVTSRSSRVTYANYYCALCNDDLKEIQSWVPRVECPLLFTSQYQDKMNASQLLSKIKFNNGAWGINITLKGETEYFKCLVDPYIPETVVETVRLCKEMVSSCPIGYKDEEVKDLCDSYTSVIYNRRTAYRNYHCALCNDISAESMTCFNHQRIRLTLPNDFNAASFSILMDFNTHGQSNTIGHGSCPPTEVWDSFFNKCRPVFCPLKHHVYRNGKCTFSTNNLNVNNTTVIDDGSEGSKKTTYHLDHKVYSNETHKFQKIILLPDEIPNVTNQNITTHVPVIQETTFLNCNRVLLPVGEFTFGDNGAIIIPKYRKQLSFEQYIKHDDGVLVCLTDSAGDKFSNVMGWVSLIGLGLSFVCLVLHLVIFTLSPEMRNLSGKNLSSLCVTLLGAYTSFIFGVFGEEGKTECFVLAVLMYYFFLASFCWMNVMAFDVWKSLRLATSELRVSAGGQWKRFFLYCAYAWIAPGAALSIVVAIDTHQPADIPKSFLPQFGERLCWFGQRKALLVFFAAPLMVIMVVNITFFILAAKIIADSTRSTAKFSSYQPHQYNFKLYMRLALLMGLAWISGIMAGYLQEETLWYIFIILNTLQGAFIFIGFTCRKNILKALRCCNCSKTISSRFISSDSPDKRGLESRDSNNSQMSHSSESQLTPRNDTSSTSISM